MAMSMKTYRAKLKLLESPAGDFLVLEKPPTSSQTAQPTEFRGVELEKMEKALQRLKTVVSPDGRVYGYRVELDSLDILVSLETGKIYVYCHACGRGRCSHSEELIDGHVVNILSAGLIDSPVVAYSDEPYRFREDIYGVQPESSLVFDGFVEVSVGGALLPRHALDGEELDTLRRVARLTSWVMDAMNSGDPSIAKAYIHILYGLGMSGEGHKEFVKIIGRPGIGKSTFVSILLPQTVYTRRVRLSLPPKKVVELVEELETLTNRPIGLSTGTLIRRLESMGEEILVELDYDVLSLIVGEEEAKRFVEGWGDGDIWAMSYLSPISAPVHDPQILEWHSLKRSQADIIDMGGHGRLMKRYTLWGDAVVYDEFSRNFRYYANLQVSTTSHNPQEYVGTFITIDNYEPFVTNTLVEEAQALHDRGTIYHFTHASPDPSHPKPMDRLTRLELKRFRRVVDTVLRDMWSGWRGFGLFVSRLLRTAVYVGEAPSDMIITSVGSAQKTMLYRSHRLETIYLDAVATSGERLPINDATLFQRLYIAYGERVARQLLLQTVFTAILRGGWSEAGELVITPTDLYNAVRDVVYSRVWLGQPVEPETLKRFRDIVADYLEGRMETYLDAYPLAMEYIESGENDVYEYLVNAHHLRPVEAVAMIMAVAEELVMRGWRPHEHYLNTSNTSRTAQIIRHLASEVLPSGRYVPSLKWLKTLQTAPETKTESAGDGEISIRMPSLITRASMDEAVEDGDYEVT